MNTRILTEAEGTQPSHLSREVAMNAQHDRLAQVLQDISERFPDDAFTKHQRLRGLLADHLPDAEREIRVALDAIDEGVIDMYRDSAAHELGMRIDRLVMRLENSRGIREDIGRPVILAYGYALGQGELPSKSVTVVRDAGAQATEVNTAGDDWIGATVIATADAAAPHVAAATEPMYAGGASAAATHGAATAATPLATGASVAQGNSKTGMIALAVAAVVGLYYLGSQPDPQPQTPGSQPQQEQPAPTAAPASGPTNAPTKTPIKTPATAPAAGEGAPAPAADVPQQQPAARRSTPAPVRTPAVQTPAAVATGVAYWYDPYGVVWQLEFNGNEFAGIGRQNNVPVASMIGLLDPPNNQLQYEIYDASDSPIGAGQGSMTDPTHIQFITHDPFGMLIGQGTFHINHPPNS